MTLVFYFGASGPIWADQAKVRWELTHKSLDLQKVQLVNHTLSRDDTPSTCTVYEYVNCKTAFRLHLKVMCEQHRDVKQNREFIKCVDWAYMQRKSCLNERHCTRDGDSLKY